ncbi:MAG: mandelate racemase/muconate lactonizing enzyme family protein [Burkholderiaceae bacterium]|nr:mandelate racemase/muconate lactonizing enzyme family protein [Burkholderiaceae bacterium]
MKVTALETIRLDEYPNLIWVLVHTDEGLTGLGETFFGARAVEAYLHESVAPYLLGQDPLRIDRHSRDMVGYVGFRGTGVETRGNSAVDIALWDLLGKASGQPIYQLLGGLTRDKVRVYNTCAGYRYIRERPVQEVDNWGLPAAGASEGPYEDLDAFLNRADELAISLVEEGFTGMKIWPFDAYAHASDGMYISPADLDRALEPFRKIRRAVGNKIDIMVEFHSLWNLPAATRIAGALEEFDPFWFEDPVRVDGLTALAEFARRTKVPVCSSELLASRWGFRDLLAEVPLGVVMFDLCWVGGLSEGRKIASMAEAWHLPVAPHDCVGPVTVTANVHLAVNATNALIQEIVRASYTSWYRELLTELPRVERGYIYPLQGPGLGTSLQPGIGKRKDATLRRSQL